MTSQHDKPKRWRPRFSVRTLVIVVTLVCAYLGCWEATKTWGIPAVPEPPSLGQLTSPCPFVIVKPESWIILNSNVYNLGGYDRRYYFWFFGYVAKLPFETSPQL